VGGEGGEKKRARVGKAGTWRGKSESIQAASVKGYFKGGQRVWHEGGGHLVKRILKRKINGSHTALKKKTKELICGKELKDNTVEHNKGKERKRKGDRSQKNRKEKKAGQNKWGGKAGNKRAWKENTKE